MTEIAETLGLSIACCQNQGLDPFAKLGDISIADPNVGIVLGLETNSFRTLARHFLVTGASGDPKLSNYATYWCFFHYLCQRM